MNTQSIRFSAKLNFIPRHHFDQKAEDSVYVNWGFKLRRRDTRKCHTKDATTCTIGAMYQSFQEGMISHIVPLTDPVLSGDIQDAVPQEEQMTAIPKGLTQEFGYFVQHDALTPVRGLIMGGADLKKHVPGRFMCEGHIVSQQYFDLLKQCYEKLSLPTSIFWGQGDSNSSNALYEVAEDTWYLCSQRNTIQEAEDLKRTYSFINIADNDELFIEGNPVPPDQVRQNTLI